MEVVCWSLPHDIAKVTSEVTRQMAHKQPHGKRPDIYILGAYYARTTVISSIDIGTDQMRGHTWIMEISMRVLSTCASILGEVSKFPFFLAQLISAFAACLLL